MNIVEEFAAVLRHAEQTVQARPAWLRNSSDAHANTTKRGNKRNRTRNSPRKKKR